MPPIKQKLAYVKGIARNRFGYWDECKGAILLDNYIGALRGHGYDDAQINDDLETEVIPATKRAKNWTQWRNTLEGWIEQISKWEKENSKKALRESMCQRREVTLDELEYSADYTHSLVSDKLDALLHISKIFRGFDTQRFVTVIHANLASFVAKGSRFI